MSTQKITDYLIKQIFIEKNVVTYRLLSREFSIHVNDAKNELATYHENAPFQGQTCFATYLLCGKISIEPSETQDEYGDMDMDMDQSTSIDIEDDSEEVAQMKVTLVNEKDLEDAKAQYTHLNSIHVYSLSPSPLPDADIICVPTADIRAVDAQKGPEFGKSIGKVIGKDVQERKGGMTIREAKAAAAQAKKDAARTSAAVPKAPSKGAPKQDEPAKEKLKPEEKPKNVIKPSGKLDFFKAKPKETKKEEAKTKADDKKKQFFTEAKPMPATRAPSAASEKEAPAAKPEKRGVKRKSIANALSDTENQASTSAGPSKSPSRGASTSLRVKKGVVLSDDEDEDEIVPQRSSRRKPRAATVDSETEREAQSLMDIDDDEVIRVSRAVEDAEIKSEAAETPDETVIEVQDEDVPMEDAPAPEPVVKTRKRKEKKVIPVGRNGLKKKRVVKSRRVKDEKGYTITQDYSEYESVDEEETPPPAPAAKGKQKAQKVQKESAESEPAATKEKVVKEPAAKKASAKSKPNKIAGPTKQKGIAGFFGAPKAKK